MRFLGMKILHRYIMGEVLRAFSLALVTITCVFVLMMVMATASRVGLAPGDILRLIPFLIPGSLPFTVPVSLLFAVTVVYGRLASDNEIIAAKGAGLSVWTLLWPTILMALVLSLILSYASSEAIPRANFAAKKIMFDNLEDLLYKTLKKTSSSTTRSSPFSSRSRTSATGSCWGPRSSIATRSRWRRPKGQGPTPMRRAPLT